MDGLQGIGRGASKWLLLMTLVLLLLLSMCMVARGGQCIKGGYRAAGQSLAQKDMAQKQGLVKKPMLEAL